MLVVNATFAVPRILDTDWIAEHQRAYLAAVAGLDRLLDVVACGLPQAVAADQPTPEIFEVANGRTAELLELSRLIARALRLWSDDEKVIAWLSRPLAMLDDRSPLAVASTVEGAAIVNRILDQLEFGTPL